MLGGITSVCEKVFVREFLKANLRPLAESLSDETLEEPFLQIMRAMFYLPTFEASKVFNRLAIVCTRFPLEIV